MGCGPSRADGWGGGNDGVVSGVGGHREEEDAIGGSIGREASAGLETSPPRPPSGQGRGIAKKLIRKRSWRKSPKEFGDDDDDGVELSASAVDRAARLAWNRGNIDEIGAGKFSDLVIHQQKFLKQVASRTYHPNDDPHLGDLNNFGDGWGDGRASNHDSSEVSEGGEDGGGGVGGVEIIDLHSELFHTVKNSVLKNTACQTDPVQDEAFDWDLSDRTDIETQTLPPTRAHSTFGGVAYSDHFLQDAIVQTDQRLVFLLKRTDSAASAATQSARRRVRQEELRQKTQQRVRFHDAWCQTYIEVQEIGVQVDPRDLEQPLRVTASFAEEAEQPVEAVSVRSDVADDEDGVLNYSSAGGDENDDEGLFSASISSSKLSFDYAQSDAGFQVNLALENAGGHSDPIPSSPMTAQSTIARQRFDDSGGSAGEIAAARKVAPVAAAASSLIKKKMPPSRSATVAAHGARPKRRRHRAVVLAEKVDVAVQTDPQTLSPSSPSQLLADGQDQMYQAVPSPLRKYEVIGEDPNLFTEIDSWVLEASKKRYKSLRKIVKVLLSRLREVPKYRGQRQELIKIRAFFRWATENITYDPSCQDLNMSTVDILRERRASGRQFAKVFGEMCELSGVTVKHIKGFAKGTDYMPGDDFVPGESGSHAWNVVFVFGAWRLLDCAFGAGVVDPFDGSFEKKLNEHFFLTDPDEFIYSHFPYDETEAKYSRWQLLWRPVSLSTFNAMPRLMPLFFDYSLRLGTNLQAPILVTANEQNSDPMEIHVWAWEPVRYKYKLYLASENESDALNQYVFCYLKGRHRKLCVFRVAPPEEATFYLKVFAKPEEEIISEDDTLDHVATFLIHAIEVRVAPMPWPRSDLPYGLTDSFSELECLLRHSSSSDDSTLSNNTYLEPVIRLVGDKRARVVLRMRDVDDGGMLSLSHLFDAEGHELVIDHDSDIKYTVLLNKNRLPDNMLGETNEDSSLMPFVRKRESAREVEFLVSNLPKPGFYKMQVFAKRKPRKRGRLSLPLVATLLVDYQITTNKEQTKFQGSRQRHHLSLVRLNSTTSRPTTSSLSRASSYARQTSSKTSSAPMLKEISSNEVSSSAGAQEYSMNGRNTDPRLMVAQKKREKLSQSASYDDPGSPSSSAGGLTVVSN